MTLSRNLTAAAEQLDAMVALDIPLDAADAAGLLDFLAQCRMEAEELESMRYIYGGDHPAVNVVVPVGGANERTAKDWFAKTCQFQPTRGW